MIHALNVKSTLAAHDQLHNLQHINSHISSISCTQADHVVKINFLIISVTKLNILQACNIWKQHL